MTSGGLGVQEKRKKSNGLSRKTLLGFLQIVEFMWFLNSFYIPNTLGRRVSESKGNLRDRERNNNSVVHHQLPLINQAKISG